MGTIRITKKHRIHAIDLVAAVCKKNRNDAAAIIRRLLKEGTFSDSDFVYDRLFHADKENKMRLVTFENAINLIMRLPGSIAKKSCAEFARVLHLYIAGDRELMEGFEKNAESSRFICVLARESLKAERAAASQSQGSCDQAWGNCWCCFKSSSSSILPSSVYIYISPLQSITQRPFVPPPFEPSLRP